MQQVQGKRRVGPIEAPAVVSSELFGFRAGLFQGQLGRANKGENGRSRATGMSMLPAYILEDIGCAEHDYSGEFA